MVITDLAVFSVERGSGLTLLEHAPGVTVDQIKDATGCGFAVSPSLKPVPVG